MSAINLYGYNIEIRPEGYIILGTKGNALDIAMSLDEACEIINRINPKTGGKKSAFKHC